MSLLRLLAMLNALPIKKPQTAAAGAIGLAVIGVGALTGWAAFFIAFFMAAAGGLGWWGWKLNRRLTHYQRFMRQMRFIGDRLQALVRSMPIGYCLFSAQGILREEVGAATRLHAEKVAHFDDIVAAIKEGPELIEAFRRLQQTEKPFSLLCKTVRGDNDIQISGCRFRIGREGPQIDALWFSDSGAAAEKWKKQSSALAEAETRERESQAMLDVLPVPVWGRTSDLNLIMCNRAYAKALDVTEIEVLRHQHELMSYTARGGSGRGLAANALATGLPQRERRHVIIAGKRRLLEITELPFHVEPSANPEKKAEGIVALLGYAVDVTAEEDRETELQRHIAAQREVMEHLGSAISIYGRDQRLEFYNRAYVRLWEAEESFLSTKPTFTEILEDLRTRRRLPEQADFMRYKKERLALFTSLLEPQEDQMYLPDGTSLRILAIPHPFGGIMFVHENITDRLALESSYNTLMAVRRETLDNLTEGIAVFGSNGKLNLFNPAFATIWKLDAAYLEKSPHITELLERMKPLLHTSENWEDLKKEMVTNSLDRNPHAGCIERADNAIVEYATVPLPDGAVLNTYLDISDTVRVEDALRASNAALATADRLKSDFVANVSYQLRTPLNTIAGCADILKEQYFGTLNEKQLEYTSSIKTESEKLAHLINDVLDVSIIEAGRMALERKPVAVADLLNDAKRMTAEWARQQQLQIVIDCPSDLGALEVDENRMKQVMFNLISNAIKYTPAGGQIALGGRRANGWVELSVTDTGIGIPAADRDRIFGKFERSNLQARQNGTGLGLSLVKSLVELHGGRVELITDEKQGTRVNCYLPAKAAGEKEDQ